MTKYLDGYGIRVRQYDREPLTRGPWTPAIAIEGMDKYGIDLAYQSAATYYTRMAELNKKGAQIYTGDTPRRLARETNDYGARIVADSKGRFRLFAVLPQADVDASLQEIEYALSAATLVRNCRRSLGPPSVSPDAVDRSAILPPPSDG